MLLQALKALSEREDRLPGFYALQPVGYRVDLDRTGKVASFVEVPKDAPPLAIPYRTRTSKPVPLPIDKGEYVFGIPPAGRRPDGAAIRHSLWLHLLDDLFEVTGLPAVESVRRFASSSDPSALSLPEKFDPSRFIAIYVDGSLFVDDQSVQRWWEAGQLGGHANDPPTTQCSVCGNSARVVENITTQIRGLSSIGGKGPMALVSGNLDVFERHGLQRASGADICTICGEATHQALNQLIADPSRSRLLGTSRFMWWTTESTDDFIGALVAGDTDESVAQVFEAVLGGKELPRISTSRFFALTIGANVNRVVIRSWLDITLADALANTRAWLQRIAMVTHDGDRLQHPGLYSLAASLAPPGQGSPLSRVAPAIIDDVLRSALSGAPLPFRVLAQCIDRIRAEQGRITVPRAALLKATMSRRQKEDFMTELDVTSDEPAYLCGRLLTLFDQAGRLATSANNTLIDRYYASASTMPALTFPRLIKLHQAHMDKLRRDRPGAAHRIQEEVEGVMSRLSAFPRTFGPTEQGRFALGLYHQQVANRAAARAARGNASANDDRVDADAQEMENP